MPDQKLKQLEPRSYPRVEFLALKPEIEALMQQGYSAMGIFRKLKEGKGLLMGYSSLTKYIRDLETKTSPGLAVKTIRASSLTHNQGNSDRQGQGAAVAPPEVQSTEKEEAASEFGKTPKSYEHVQNPDEATFF